MAEAASREQARVNRVVKARINFSIREAVAEVEEAVASVGEIMTSHNETEILQSLSDLAGP